MQALSPSRPVVYHHPQVFVAVLKYEKSWLKPLCALVFSPVEWG